MKKTLLLFILLIVSVMTTACINKFAVEELNNKAAKYIENGNTEAAICRLKSSLDLDDDFYQTHYNLATAYYTLGNYDGAIEEAERVLQLKPDFYDAIHISAMSKDQLLYSNINETISESGKETILSKDEISDFINKANEVIEMYNDYLVKKINSDDEDKVNARIEEINNSIKLYSSKLDSTSEENDKEAVE